MIGDSLDFYLLVPEFGRKLRRKSDRKWNDSWSLEILCLLVKERNELKPKRTSSSTELCKE